MKHELENVTPFSMATPMRYSYKCRICGARIGHHYTSHRKGWIWTANYFKPCRKATPPIFALLGT